MKNAQVLSMHRHLSARAAFAVLSMSVGLAAHAGQTDIASTPIVTTSAALVKPNIMLLMDASGSMKRTHMPDELENVTKPTSVGYKASQCNSLYYNPRQQYFVPKRYDGSLFPTPSFTSAPYAGYGSYYATPDLSTTDLSTAFVAYDASTLEAGTGSDTPQAAYYYVYADASNNVPDKLSFAAAPCKDLDQGGNRAATGGGSWTKVNVASLSADDKQNFAIWYSYYRTRLSLIKSAASLAFSPLNDTKRVGFITVQPKDAPDSSTINPVRYLPLGDFNSSQKNLWFSKLFSQQAGGASPAREGLARVGRYYGGKEDGINAGMPATGANDPIQYACQQNFTIMTTDGYWNGQTESTNVLGGGVDLPGTSRVGQQDGDPTCPLSDPYCPRPIWDGVSGSTHVVTHVSNAYTDNTCSLASRYRQDYQTQRQVETKTRDVIRTTKQTLQYYERETQPYANTTQTTLTHTSDQRTTDQYVAHKVHFVELRYKHIKSQDQTTKTTEQWQLKTTQRWAQTFQTKQISTSYSRKQEQWTMSSSQYVMVTTQYKQERDQYKSGVRQVARRQYQIVAYDHSNEGGPAVDGNCVSSPNNYPIECRIKDYITQDYVPNVASVTAQFVDPDSCSDNSTGDAQHVRTACSNGPNARPYVAVASCAPSFDAATQGNNYTETRCDKIVIDPPTSIAGTCSGTTQGPGPDFYVYICSRPTATNKSTPVSSCSGTDPATAQNDYVTSTCTQPAATNYATRPAPACQVQTYTDPTTLVTTVCAKPVDGPPDIVPSCSDDPGTTGPNYLKVTCSAPIVVDNGPMPSASCVAGPSGNVMITCPKTPQGPYATAQAVQTCNDGDSSGNPYYYETTCTFPSGANNQTVFVPIGSCSLGFTAGTASSWIDRDCTKPPGANNTSDYADPRSCSNNDGTNPPYLKVTCDPQTTIVAGPVGPSQCPLGTGLTDITYYSGPNNSIATHCQKQIVSGPTDVSQCSTPQDPEQPPYIVTSCGEVDLDVPLANACVPNSQWMDGNDTVTCLYVHTGPTQVPTCTSDPGGPPNYIHVSCAGSTTSGRTAVNPQDCQGGPYTTATEIITCYTDPIGPYMSPQPLAGCSEGTDSSFVTTHCTYPGPHNFAERPTAYCDVAGQGTTDGGTQITRYCRTVDSGVFYTSYNNCVSSGQVGSGPVVTCTHTNLSGVGQTTAACATGDDPSGPYFDRITQCNSDVTQPMADYSGVCTAGPTGNANEFASCGRRSLGSAVADSGCSDHTDPTTGVITECTNTPGSGHTYTVTTTTTVTTTPFSGTVAAGPGTVATSSSGPTPYAGGQCFISPQTFPPDPVDVTVVNPGAGGSENSLADVAQYYYKTDLRPSMPNIVPKSGSGPEDDNAPHQHMTTFAIALGVSGTLNFRPDYRSTSTLVGDFADIRTGVKNWPLWPDPTLNYAQSSNYDNPKSIDDYWHTAVNGRGKFFSASNPTSVIQGLGDALAKIDSTVASGAPVGVSSVQPVNGNNFAYGTSYESGAWDGDLSASTIDLGSGQPSAPVWSAKALLGGRTFAACDNRTIYLMRGSSAFGNFTWNTDICPTGTPSGSPVTDLTTSEKDFFGPLNIELLSQYPYMTDGTGNTVQQQQEAKKPGYLVNFIRGQRGLEDYESNSLTKLFRHRESVLGDMVGSQPVYVAQPFANYQDVGYAAFKGNNALRTPMVYVGANDGMLHAFYATLDPNPLLKAGQEAWAVIPSTVLPNLYKLADDNYKRDGHQFYVDGTPVVADTCSTPCTGASDWKTILVGGLNAGGKGYYALDVTDPANPRPLWEFKQNGAVCPSTPSAAVGNTADCNLGFTFGKPVVTKLAGVWVVMVTSGYNNVNSATNGQDGGGFLYVLNAATGAIIHKIPTEVSGANVGTGSSPSGLAQINNYVDNAAIDNTTLRVYGGDVLGNMWRFDFLPTPQATRLATALDTSSNVQPITVRPELAELDGKPFVMFGTGRLLGASDVTDPKIQSVYGFRDTLATGATVYSAPRTSFKPLKINQSGTLATAVRTIQCTSNTSADCDRTDGWVLDLAEAGERVNVEMKLVVSTLVFVSNVPEQVPCSVGGHSWFNVVDFRTGGPVDGTVNGTISDFVGNALSSGFTVVRLPPSPGFNNGSFKGLVRGSTPLGGAQPDGFTKPESIPTGEPPVTGKRISWREIPAQ